MTEPNRAFKGIWINAELWNDTELSHTEKFLIAEIDSLTSEDHPCYATAERLAKAIQVSVERVNHMLSSLQKRKHLICLGFDGKRKFRIVAPLLSSNPATSKAWSAGNLKFKPCQKQQPLDKGLSKMTNQPCQKQQGSLVENDNRKSPPNIEENTNKEQHTARARAKEPQDKLAADVSVLSLPLFLQSDGFKKALQALINHRKLIKRPMTQDALEQVVGDCEKWGEKDAIANIYYSIKLGWQGVFEKPADKPPPRKPKF
jgi:hypothetical protein